MYAAEARTMRPLPLAISLYRAAMRMKSCNALLCDIPLVILREPEDHHFLPGHRINVD